MRDNACSAWFGRRAPFSAMARPHSVLPPACFSRPGTFPEADAGSISNFMIKQRERSDQASRVIKPEKFIFQAIGAYRTVKGVCGTARG